MNPIIKYAVVPFLAGYGGSCVVRDIISKVSGKCTCHSVHNEFKKKPDPVMERAVKEAEALQEYINSSSFTDTLERFSAAMEQERSR